MSLLERPVYTYREANRLLGLNPDIAELDSQVWMVVDTGQHALSPRTDRFFHLFHATTYALDRDAAEHDDDVAIEVTIDPRYPDVKLNPLLRSGRPR